VGLVAREIEAAGFSTVVLSQLPAWTAAVGAPRIAAIEHPFGQTVGAPGDGAGQTAVLRATLAALVEIQEPGTVRHLPFRWSGPEPEDGPEPPIVAAIRERPSLYRKLLAGDIPDG
jgi:D-proline reductase (dithiol) PrdB